MHQATNAIFFGAARWNLSVSVQRHRWRHRCRQGTPKALIGATVAFVAVMARLPSTWARPAMSVSGLPTSHVMPLSSYRQARAFAGSRCKGLAEFDRKGKVALAAKKKKKHVDSEILEKRARAAAIREEAIRKAAETKRLKELGQTAETAPAKPMIPAKQASPSPAVAAAKPAKPAASSHRATTPPRKPAPTDNGRKNPRSVAELRAIQSLDRLSPQGTKKGRTEGATGSDIAGKNPTKEEVMKMKVVDLKDVLRTNRLKVGGRKADLLERVLSFIEAA